MVSSGFSLSWKANLIEMATKPKLVYFSSRGKAEIIRYHWLSVLSPMNALFFVVKPFFTVFSRLRGWWVSELFFWWFIEFLQESFCTMLDSTSKKLELAGIILAANLKASWRFLFFFFLCDLIYKNLYCDLHEAFSQLVEGWGCPRLWCASAVARRWS